MRRGRGGAPSLDAIAIVEAAYQVQGADERWLRTVVEASASSLERRMGMYALMFSVQQGRLVIDEWVQTGMSEEAMDSLKRMAAGMNPVFLEKGMRRFQPGIATNAIMFEPEAIAYSRNHLERFGAADLLCLTAHDTADTRVFLAAPTKEEIGRIDARTRRAWSRVAVHIAAGARLRRALRAAESASVPLGGEAVLSPDCRVLHAEGDARARDARIALRTAARRIDRARSGCARGNAEEVLRLWRGLVDGRWSLIDFFDKDGQRFVIARRNEPEARDPRALSPRERQVTAFAARGASNKLIAYTLGISEAAVAHHLKSSSRKLGVASKTELIALMSVMPPPVKPNEDRGE